jgi:hypothetical protein
MHERPRARRLRNWATPPRPITSPPYALVLRETTLLPHVNIGVITEAEEIYVGALTLPSSIHSGSRPSSSHSGEVPKACAYSRAATGEIARAALSLDR